MNGIKLDFKSYADVVQKELDRAERRNRIKASNVAKGKLKDAAPVDTGNLKRSIKTKHNKRSSAVGFTRPEGSHAWLVENGHDIIRNGVKVGRAKGKPFFKPTWDAMLPELKNIMSETLL